MQVWMPLTPPLWERLSFQVVSRVVVVKRPEAKILILYRSQVTAGLWIGLAKEDVPIYFQLGQKKGSPTRRR